MFKGQFDIMTSFSLEYFEGKQQMCFLSVICNVVFLMHCIKNESGYASISMDAAPLKQRCKYYYETSIVDSLFN